MQADGVLLDVDGTLLDSDDTAYSGAVAAVRTLIGRGLRVRYLTNTTRRGRDDVAARLADAGFPLDADALFTAPVAAATWLRKQGYTRLALYVTDATLADFAGFDIDETSPQAVVIGDLGAGWDAATLNRAFLPVLSGARLVALQKNRWWHSALGPALDAGAYVAALEYAARAEAVVVGKPSVAFFRLAAEGMNIPADRLIVVGDDVDTDIAGAHNAGLRAVLVRTGRYRDNALARATAAPAAVLDSIADLPDLLTPTTTDA